MAPSALPTFAALDFDRARVFQTRDLDEIRECSARALSPHSLSVVGTRNPLDARLDHLPLGELSLMRLRWGAPVAVDPDRLSGYYLLSMPTRGCAEFSLDRWRHTVTPLQAAVVSPSQRFHFQSQSDFEQVLLRVDRQAVENSWQALAGRPLPRTLTFDSALRTDGPGWQALQPVLQLLARSLPGAGRPGAGTHLLARVQDMVVLTLLTQLAHDQQGQLLPTAGAAPPACVRRAQDHMRAHLAEPLTASGLALACGVPLRTLQAAFQRSHGCGPMRWLREQRLDRVREALIAGGAEAAPVTDTALRFGFTHLGEFSRHYRHKFGETPSQTVARHR